jgi:hypothetical protein
MLPVYATAPNGSKTIGLATHSIRLPSERPRRPGAASSSVVRRSSRGSPSAPADLHDMRQEQRLRKHARRAQSPAPVHEPQRDCLPAAGVQRLERPKSGSGRVA